MDILVDYQGDWGFGDILCSDPMFAALAEKYGPSSRIFIGGKIGNVLHNPHVVGVAADGQSFDHTVEVQLFSHMNLVDYAELERMPSLIDHMCGYAGLEIADRNPRLYLGADDMDAAWRLPPKSKIRIGICADYDDPLRHWPVDRWQEVARFLHDAGVEVVGVGRKHQLGVGFDLVGQFTIRESAAALTTCDLFLGNNSGLFHYAQAAGLPCVTLFSVATPERFMHPGSTVYPIETEGLPCLHCMSGNFLWMLQNGCVAETRGRCITDISVAHVLDTVDRALQDFETKVTEPTVAKS